MFVVCMEQRLECKAATIRRLAISSPAVGEQKLQVLILSQALIQKRSDNEIYWAA